MKTTLILITIVISLTGCMNPNLCDTKKRLDRDTGLPPEYLLYFKDKPTLSVSEAHGTLLPVAHMRKQIQKRSDGYLYVNHVSLLGGLFLEGKFTDNFDREGKRKKNDYQSASLDMLAGLLFELDVDVNPDDLSGFINKSFLLKAFGSTQEVGGSKYYTIFWMPMKFSNQSIDPTRKTPVD